MGAFCFVRPLTPRLFLKPTAVVKCGRTFSKGGQPIFAWTAIACLTAAMGGILLAFYLHHRARDRPALAVHEAGHAIIAWASGRVQRVDEADLGCFFGNGGWVKYSFAFPNQLFSETDYLSEITVSLAGQVADQLMGTDRRWFLSAAADCRHAVEAAERLVQYRCRHQNRSRPRRTQRWQGRRLSSEALEVIARCSRTAETYLSRNRWAIVKLSRALLAHNRLDTGQLADILGPKIPPDHST